MFAEDVALMRDEEEKRWPWAILDADKEMLTRQIPDMFTVYKVKTSTFLNIPRPYKGQDCGDIFTAGGGAGGRGCLIVGRVVVRRTEIQGFIVSFRLFR